MKASPRFLAYLTFLITKLSCNLAPTTPLVRLLCRQLLASPEAQPMNPSPA